MRASAVTSLAKFGAVVEYLRPRIIILLKRCLYDNDDEVRSLFSKGALRCLSTNAFSFWLFDIKQEVCFTLSFPYGCLASRCSLA